SELVEFDFERPETFAPALEGVERVFLIARPGDEQADRVAIPLIDEMKRQGVRHVVNLTAMGVEMLEGMALKKVERYLEDSGIGFYRLVRQGFCAPVSADVQTVLGRPPVSFAQFARDHAACWM